MNSNSKPLSKGVSLEPPPKQKKVQGMNHWESFQKACDSFQERQKQIQDTPEDAFAQFAAKRLQQLEEDLKDDCISELTTTLIKYSKLNQQARANKIATSSSATDPAASNLISQLANKKVTIYKVVT